MTDPEHAALVLELGARVVGDLVDENWSPWNAGWEIEGRALLARSLAWECYETELSGA